MRIMLCQVAVTFSVLCFPLNKLAAVSLFSPESSENINFFPTNLSQSLKLCLNQEIIKRLYTFTPSVRTVNMRGKRHSETPYKVGVKYLMLKQNQDERVRFNFPLFLKCTCLVWFSLIKPLLTAINTIIFFKKVKSS